jgi:hypothetical protein
VRNCIKTHTTSEREQRERRKKFNKRKWLVEDNKKKKIKVETSAQIGSQSTSTKFIQMLSDVQYEALGLLVG